MALMNFISLSLSCSFYLLSFFYVFHLPHYADCVNFTIFIFLFFSLCSLSLSIPALQDLMRNFNSPINDFNIYSIASTCLTSFSKIKNFNSLFEFLLFEKLLHPIHCVLNFEIWWISCFTSKYKNILFSNSV